MSSIVVVGSMNVDYVMDVDHMPVAGETILSSGFSIIPGGKGANQAFALGRMGAQVTMLGMVGNDQNGAIELDSLSNAGVCLSHVGRADQPTGLALIPIDRSGENMIIVIPGANNAVTPAYIDAHRDVILQSDIVLLQLEIPMETVIHTARLAKEAGKIVILDPAPASGPLPGALLKNLDYIKPNVLELAVISGCAQGIPLDVEAACARLLHQGVGCVLASLGDRGVFISGKGAPPTTIPARAVSAVDTTAAGDSFIAAVAFALAGGKEIVEAVRFANDVAAIVVQRRGAQTSIPTRAEIEALYAAGGAL